MDEAEQVGSFPLPLSLSHPSAFFMLIYFSQAKAQAEAGNLADNENGVGLLYSTHTAGKFHGFSIPLQSSQRIATGFHS